MEQQQPDLSLVPTDDLMKALADRSAHMICYVVIRSSGHQEYQAFPRFSGDWFTIQGMATQLIRMIQDQWTQEEPDVADDDLGQG